MYVVNLKAGSRTFRAALRSIGADLWDGADWKHATCRNETERMVLPSVGSACMKCPACKCMYPTTQCFSAEQLAAANIVTWSFVRDPIGKLESGMQQMRHAFPSKYGHVSADEMLAMQLQLYNGSSDVSSSNVSSSDWQHLWLDSHLVPSSFQLSGRDVNGKILWPQFIGRLELLNTDSNSDWHALLIQLALPWETPLPTGPLAENTHPLSANLPTAAHSLSEDSVRRMCDAPLYAHEWRCFGYARPDVCKTQPSLLCCHGRTVT